MNKTEDFKKKDDQKHGKIDFGLKDRLTEIDNKYDKTFKEFIDSLDRMVQDIVRIRNEN